MRYQIEKNLTLSSLIVALLLAVPFYSDTKPKTKKIPSKSFVVEAEKTESKVNAKIGKKVKSPQVKNEILKSIETLKHSELRVLVQLTQQNYYQELKNSPFRNFDSDVLNQWTFEEAKKNLISMVKSLPEKKLAKNYLKLISNAQKAIQIEAYISKSPMLSMNWQIWLRDINFEKQASQETKRLLLANRLAPFVKQSDDKLLLLSPLATLDFE